MKEITVFNHEMFGDIRTMTNERGETFFVGKDVAKALGYSNTRKALLDHVDTEDRVDGVTIRDAIGRNQKTVLINESGLYALVLSSKLPQAKVFKRWVTSEVLPQIRLTGGYIPTHDGEGRQLTAEEILERANEIVGRTLRHLNAPSMQCMTATEVACSWDMEVCSFNQLLCRMGVQQRKGGAWRLVPSLQGQGLTETRTFIYYSLNGQGKRREYMVWTKKGVDMLNRLVSTQRNRPYCVLLSKELN
jgi:prophage antirepressor-like protein